MKANKVHERASMLGLGRKDSERLITAQRTRDLPVRAWFKNYESATPQAKDQIISILREGDDD